MLKNNCCLDIGKLTLEQVKEKLDKHYSENPEILQQISDATEKNQLDVLYRQYFCIYECPVMFC